MKTFLHFLDEAYRVTPKRLALLNTIRQNAVKTDAAHDQARRQREELMTGAETEGQLRRHEATYKIHSDAVGHALDRIDRVDAILNRDPNTRSSVDQEFPPIDKTDMGIIRSQEQKGRRGRYMPLANTALKQTNREYWETKERNALADSLLSAIKAAQKNPLDGVGSEGT
jgi:hypothetical protein